MSKLLLRAAILLLSSAWTFVQVSASPTDQNQSQQPDKSQTTNSDHKGDTVEGCLTGGANTFTLTDAKHRTYQLTGDTKELNENVGHKVRLYGNAGNAGPDPYSVWGSQATFGVKKVESLADTCK